MKDDLVYVTGNQVKISTAKHFLGKAGIKIQQQKVDIDEIQSESIEDVAIDKAKKAYKVVKTPLFVNDSGWIIPALNGFPGPFMKHINHWFKAEDFLSLMSEKVDDTVILKEVYVYYDGTDLKVFSYEYKGKILKEVKGKGLPSEMVMSLSEDGISIAEKNTEERREDRYNKFWEEFPRWYLNYK